MTNPKDDHLFLPQHGHYRQLRVYRVTEALYDLTYLFCQRFMPNHGDRTVDQMVQAARSGKQNIAEGNQAAATSSDTEIRLTNVARASLEELLDDYEDYLRTRRLQRWELGHPRLDALRRWTKSDSFFKRFSAESFYRLLNSMGAEVKFNHADYRLISSRALDELEKYGEVNLYLRGLVPMLGFKSKDVFYERHERIAGESHYPLGKMLALAFNGITSLTVKPIRLITGFGFAVSFLSFIAIIWAVIRALTGHTVAGWASMTCIICFFCGIILLSLGVIGEYIGKIYLETKRRPRYIIEESTLD
jgi:four helix bundle protein